MYYFVFANIYFNTLILYYLIFKIIITHRYTWILPVEVQLQNQVGAGKMGSVYKAEWKGWTVAVKKTVCTATEAVRVDWAGGWGVAICKTFTSMLVGLLQLVTSVISRQRSKCVILSSLRYPLVHETN